MNVEDYVRTKDGRIGKIIQEEYITPCNDKHRYIYLINADNEMWYDEETIIKSSPNIIDLIEVGDYVNGFEVLRVDKECNLYPKTLKCQYPNNTDYFDVFNEDIKSIVTREQFSQMEYKVE